MKILIIALLNLSLIVNLSLADATGVKPDPWKTSEYSVYGVEGRFAAYMGLVPLVLDAKLRKQNPKTYIEAIEAFGPAFTSRLSSVGYWSWYFNDSKMYRVSPRWSSGLNDVIELNILQSDIQVLEKRPPHSSTPSRK